MDDSLFQVYFHTVAITCSKFKSHSMISQHFLLNMKIAINIKLPHRLTKWNGSDNVQPINTLITNYINVCKLSWLAI